MSRAQRISPANGGRTVPLVPGTGTCTAGPRPGARHRDLAPSGQATEDQSEEGVADGCLPERARVCQERRDARLAARRVVAVDEIAEGIEARVLRERKGEREPPLVDLRVPTHGLEDQTEHRPVERVQDEPGRPPGA